MDGEALLNGKRPEFEEEVCVSFRSRVLQAVSAIVSIGYVRVSQPRSKTNKDGYSSADPRNL